jgi:hypothetical protein
MMPPQATDSMSCKNPFLLKASSAAKRNLLLTVHVLPVSIKSFCNITGGAKRGGFGAAEFSPYLFIPLDRVSSVFLYFNP